MRSDAETAAAPSGVLSTLVLRLLDTADALGADRTALLRACKATEAALRDPDARLPVEVYPALWAEIRRQLPDAPVPVACAQAERAADFGLVGYLAQQGPRLDDALHVLVRYQRLFHEGIGHALERDGAVLRAVFPLSAQVRAIPQVAQSCALSFIAGVRLILGEVRRPDGRHGPWAPRSVDLPHGPPSYAAAIRDFAGAPVRFNAPCCAVSLAPEDLALPARAPDPALAVWLRAQADTTLSRLAPALPTSEAVTRRLVDSLPRGEGTQSATARALGLGERTLQRRLADEGTTFAALLERSRRDLAEGFLRDRRLSGSEVAFLLGYADPSTFFRAFKRWTGQTPQQFRAGARNER